MEAAKGRARKGVLLNRTASQWQRTWKRMKACSTFFALLFSGRICSQAVMFCG